MKKILIEVQNPIQWYAIRDFIKLAQKKYSVVIEVYGLTGQKEGFERIAKETADIITKDGFKITKEPVTKADVAFAAYADMLKDKEIGLKIKYCYGAAETKPLFVLNPIHQLGYDLFFVHDINSYELFSAYNETIIVPYLHLKKTKKSYETSTKPTVLYMPTYNNPDVPQVLKALAKLKDTFNIAIKLHHGTKNLDKEKDTKNRIETIADTIYGPKDDINDLIEKVDCILTDNSGSFADALHTNTPLAIVLTELEAGPNNTKTAEVELIEKGVLPHTDKLTASSIKTVIQKALTKENQKIQAEAAEKLFPDRSHDPAKWLKIVDERTNTPKSITQKIHNYISDYYEQLYAKAEQIPLLESTIQDQALELNRYKNSRAHKFVDWIQSKLGRK